MKSDEDKPIDFIQDFDVLGQPKTSLPLIDNPLPKIPSEEQSTPKTKSRNPFIAFLLSILTPGLGQVYNGQGKKAIIFFALILINPLIFGLTRGTTTIYGLFSCVIIEISVRIFIIVDAIKFAKRQKEYIPKDYNTWYSHLFMACAMIAVLNFYDAKSILGTQPFTITSNGIQPTLQVGDWIIGDMKIHENKQPECGELIVFKGTDDLFYVSRIVGLPNDKLEINDDIVSINGKQSKATFIKETLSESTPVLEFEEELPNGHKHNIYKFKYPLDSTKITIKNILVPEGYYYILGDNRDNSADSRYIGFIAKEDIVGQLIFSYWGKTKDRINIDFRNK